MTVQELIDLLRQQDPKAEAYIFDYYASEGRNSVERLCVTVRRDDDGKVVIHS